MAEKDLVNGFLDRVNSMQDRSVDVVKGIIEGKEHVTVTFQKNVMEPEREESPRRAHVFSVPDGFCAYLQKYGSDDIVVLANAETGVAQAVLDETSAVGFETITFEPKVHPLWAPWKGLIGSKVRVKDFARFVAGQGHVITIPSPKMLLMTLAQVRLSKNVTIESGFGQKALNGIMVESVIKGNSVTNPIELPDQIVVHCPMFYGTEAVDIAVDLLVDACGDEVLVNITSADAEVKRIEQIEGMLGKVADGLPNATVSLGMVHTVPWAYLTGE